MSQPLPKPEDCCEACPENTTTAIPGPQGAAGAAGTNGTNGVNAYTTLSAGFTMPAELATVVISVITSTWATIGQTVFIQTAGHMEITAKPSSTQLTVRNLEDTPNAKYPGNAAPATAIASGSTVSPAGIQGPTGAAGSATLNSISPTTTKGDIMVDNGANSPSASVVRKAVGDNGKVLHANSADGTGVAWQNIDLTGAATDLTGSLPIVNGGTGAATALAAFNALSPVTTRGDLITRDATNNVRLPIGAANTVLVTDGTDPSWAKVNSNHLSTSGATQLGRVVSDYIQIEHQATSGTAGGDFTSGAWRTRTLTTEVVDTGSHASLAVNQITLSAGTYRFQAFAAASEVNNNQLRLQNITAGTTVQVGIVENAAAVNQHAVVCGRFTIAANTVFELQHQCSLTKLASGFGAAASFGTEVYACIIFEREAV